jgi:hypothetical protein
MGVNQPQTKIPYMSSISERPEDVHDVCLSAYPATPK